MWIGRSDEINTPLFIHTPPFCRWYPLGKNFAQALKKAKSFKKPLMIFYESKRCHWCEKMKETTFHDPNVIKRVNKELIAVKLFKEDQNYPSSIQSKYTPTTFFITPDQKNIIRPVLGYVDSEYLLSYLDDVKRRKKKISSKINLFFTIIGKIY